MDRSILWQRTSVSSGFLSFHQVAPREELLMKTIIESNENYSVIDLTLEYENWTGTERYAVISDFEQDYIEKEYSSELSEFKPYLYMTSEFLDVRRNFRNNNKKYEMRSLRCESVFNFDENETEEHHTEIAFKDFVDEWIQNNELKEALISLSDIERERIFEYYIVGKTNEEIGADSGCSEAAVRKSIARGLKKLSKILKNF